MADWDVNSPSDSDFIAQFPANERAARAALVANFGVDHEANAQDANIGKHVKVSLVDQSSDPAGAANSSTLYAKGVSGASQLFWRSGTGAVVQLTAAGGLRAESLVGTVPDARLSSNVALRNAENPCTAQVVITGTHATDTRIRRGDTTGLLRLLGGTSADGTTGGHIALFGADFGGARSNGADFNAGTGGIARVQAPSGTVELNADVLDFNG